MNVFICYRRENNSVEAQAIFLRLANQIGQSRVFLDLDTLQIGDEFSQKSLSKIAGSEVFFLLIGPDWEEGVERRNIERTKDFVQIEIREAFSKKVKILPVLVDRSGRPLDGKKLPKELQFLVDLQYAELRSGNVIKDFDDICKSLSSEFPHIFSTSLAPLVLSDELRSELLKISSFSGLPVRPSAHDDHWQSVGTYEFDENPSDDFFFSVDNEGSAGPNVCFFNGYDDVTNVSRCALGKKTSSRVRLDGKRSQYGFFWPQYYFTVFGEYGASDYYYSPKSNNPFYLLFDGLLNWIFMINEHRDDLNRGALTDTPKGFARRGQSANDVLVFSTTEKSPVRYYGSFNGAEHATHLTNEGARGTIVQWSQIGGGYREFSFVIKDAPDTRSFKRDNLYFWGAVEDGDFDVQEYRAAEREELYVHPSGFPIVTEFKGNDISFEFRDHDDIHRTRERVTFKGIGGSFWPKFSFSRDGRLAAFSHTWDKKVLVLDLFSNTVAAIIPEHIDPLFSPDGERICCVRVGQKRRISVFSKRGEHRKELGLVGHDNSIQFRYLDLNHFDVHSPIQWGDTGRKLFVLHNNIVTLYELSE